MTGYSGWQFTNTTQLTACPRCGAEPGKYCHSPKGRKTNTPHCERVKLFLDFFPTIASISHRPPVKTRRAPCIVPGHTHDADFETTRTGAEFCHCENLYYLVEEVY